MKQKYIPYDNRTYLEYLQPTLKFLVRNSDPSTRLAVEKKLSEKHKTIFDKLIGFEAVISFASLNASIAASEKPRDIGKLISLKDLEKQAEKLYDDYLQTVDASLFEEAVAHIAYYLATYSLKKQVSLHNDFLKGWTEWDVYLTKKNKHKREGIKIKDKLRVVLGNVVDDLDKIQADHDESVRRTIEGKGYIFINVSEEIQLDDCIVNDILTLPPRFEASTMLIIEEYTEIVRIGEKSFTLRDYYNHIKGEMDGSWLKSKDLLKRILVIYLIKRSQQGDDEAFEKLFKFYIKNAEAKALRFIHRKAQALGKSSSFSEGGKLSDDEAKSAVSMILTVLLRGDNPAYLFSNLIKDRSQKKDDVEFLNKKPYTSLNESYHSMYIAISSQLDTLKNYQAELLSSTKDLRSRYKSLKKPFSAKHSMQRLYQISHHYLQRAEWSSTTFTLFDPLTLLRLSPHHNNHLFKPTCNGNLTLWLFGAPGKFRGRLLEGLEAWYEKQTHVSDGERRLSEEDYGHSRYEDEIAPTEE